MSNYIDECLFNKNGNTQEPPMDELQKAIDDLNNFPLTELQQRLVNYLSANVDDIAEALDIEDC